MDHQPPTANRHQPPTATNRQPPTSSREAWSLELPPAAKGQQLSHVTNRTHWPLDVHPLPDYHHSLRFV